MAIRTVSNAGGNWNATATWTGGVVPIAGDSIAFTGTSGNLTVNVASANLIGVNFTNYVGTITFNNTITTNGVLNLGTGGYTQAGASGIVLNGTATLTSGGVTWSRILRVGGTTATYTLVDNWTVTGNITFEGTGNTTFTSNTLNIRGNLTQTTTGIYLGTTAFVFGNTGTWSNSSTGAIRNNVTINTAGTLTISGNVYYNTGTFTYTAGTVTTTGSLLSIGANTTLNTNGIIWNNISGTGTTQITLTSNLTLTGTLDVRNSGSSLSFILGGNTLVSANSNLSLGTACTFTLPANQTFKTLIVAASSGTLNSNTLTITENLTINATLSGTTTIVYGGTGTWTATTNSIISNNVTINTAGTLTISGNVYKGGGTFTYTAGTIIDTGATINIGATANTTLNVSGKTWEKLLVNLQTTLTSNLNATTFGTHNIGGGSNTTFVLGAFSLNFTHLELGGGSTTILPTAWVCQDLTLTVGSGGGLSGFSITINRNFIQGGVGGTYSGTTSIIYAVPALATGTWSRTGLSYFLNPLTINGAGTINFTGGIIGGGIFTYTAGTFNCQVGSTLYNTATGTTFNGAGITWYNVVFGTVTGITSVASVTLNTQLICIGTLTIQNSATTFAGTNGTFDTYGFVLGTNATALRTTTLVSTKTYRVRQSFNSTQGTDAFRILLRSTTGGSQAIFTVDSGATIDVGFVNATDINSSLGRTIYSYKGVFSNTLNWALLPTDVTSSGGSFTFIS
jgi:hypothetical protein